MKMMNSIPLDFFCIEDFDFSNKTVAVRVDLNSHLNENLEVIENKRFERHARTIKYLLKKGAKVIVISHQGRFGESDFISLEQHARIFSKYIGKDVKYIPEIVSEKTRYEISYMQEGDVIMLNNVRFLKDETESRTIEGHSLSSLVKFLSPLIDYYILDAFSVSHRNHSSIVGFATVKPMVAGIVFTDEYLSINRVLGNTEGINTWIMGGAKIDDCIRVLKNLFSNKPEAIEKVLSGGLLSNLFLYVLGYEIGEGSLSILKHKGYLGMRKDVEDLLSKHAKEIILPEDVAIEENGSRKEVDIDNIPRNATILDVGSKTIKKYKEILSESDTVVFKGPLGMYEKPGFEKGTKEIFKILSTFDGYSLIGGGDTSLAMEKLGFDEKDFSYVSVSGGAMITFLSGKELPGLEALRLSYKKFKNLL